MVAVSLTGCVNMDGMIPDIDASGPPTSTPTLHEVPEAPLEGDLDGDGKLSAWEKEQLAKTSYTLPDGTEVPISKDEPLPPEVVEAVEAAVAPSANFITEGDTSTITEREGAYLDSLRDQSAKLGRTVIGIMPGFGVWASSSPYAHQYDTREEAIAAVTAFIGDSDQYVYIVIE